MSRIIATNLSFNMHFTIVKDISKIKQVVICLTITDNGVSKFIK